MFLPFVVKFFLLIPLLNLPPFSLSYVFIDLPPGYTYPAIAMGYRSGPSPHDVRLAEPADPESVQAEPAENAPQPLSSLGAGLECQAVVRPLPQQEVEEEEEVQKEEEVQREEVEARVAAGSCGPPDQEHREEQEEDVSVCPPAESRVCETASCPIPIPLSEEENHRADPTSTLEEQEEEKCQVERRQQQEVAGEQEEPEQGSTIIDLDPPCPAQPHQEAHTEEEEEEGGEEEQEEESTPNDDNHSVELVCLSPSSPSPCPGQSIITFSTSLKPIVPSYWSLELLIAAAFCTDVPPFPMLASSTLQPQACDTHPCPSHPHHGMELLSELADLELQQHRHNTGDSQGEEMLIFDLQSLATLAAARALELGAQEGSGAGAGRHYPARKTLNLRRKCSWTPRHEPACPAKGTMERMEGPELAMRVKLAELQRRYKEKQRELAKLQRKHDHQ
uniref:Uncharacterized protein n=1 Tax=Hucho hucho TaxID=62062 RepID=A0A4W5LXU5_9TELE